MFCQGVTGLPQRQLMSQGNTSSKPSLLQQSVVNYNTKVTLDLVLEFLAFLERSSATFSAFISKHSCIIHIKYGGSCRMYEPVISILLCH
jgi:hypothetical protein